jgi:hypothetical protein
VRVPTGSVGVLTGSVGVPTGSVRVPTGSVDVPTGSARARVCVCSLIGGNGQQGMKIRPATSETPKNVCTCQTRSWTAASRCSV